MLKNLFLPLVRSNLLEGVTYSFESSLSSIRNSIIQSKQTSITHNPWLKRFRSDISIPTVSFPRAWMLWPSTSRVLISADGTLKLSDFCRGLEARTSMWSTFCWMLDYIAPEIVQVRFCFLLVECFVLSRLWVACRTRINFLFKVRS